MALFGKKKEAKEESVVEVKKGAVSQAQSTDRNLDAIIVGPRITEKSVMQGEQNVYTFTVKRDANKFQVRDAIKALYKVTP